MNRPLDGWISLIWLDRMCLMWTDRQTDRQTNTEEEDEKKARVLDTRQHVLEWMDDELCVFWLAAQCWSHGGSPVMARQLALERKKIKHSNTPAAQANLLQHTLSNLKSPLITPNTNTLEMTEMCLISQYTVSWRGNDHASVMIVYASLKQQH